MSSSNKKIQISSHFEIDSKSLHKKSINHKTGETKQVDEETPHQYQATTTVTSNPVTYESKGIRHPHVTSGHIFEESDVTHGCNTSQL